MVREGFWKQEDDQWESRYDPGRNEIEECFRRGHPVRKEL